MTEGLVVLREQLALACRMLANEGLFDQSGHISVRHPDREGAFLIHPHSVSRYEVRPDQLLVVDFDGTLLEGDARPPSEIFIHTQIYRRRGRRRRLRRGCPRRHRAPV